MHAVHPTLNDTPSLADLVQPARLKVQFVTLDFMGPRLWLARKLVQVLDALGARPVATIKVTVSTPAGHELLDVATETVEFRAHFLLGNSLSAERRSVHWRN
jgi:hypothetical protein